MGWWGHDMHLTRRWISTAVLTLATLWTAHAHAACTFGNSQETSLQGVFDSLFAPGALSAANDCVPSSADGSWTAAGPVDATIIIELAGFADKNIFGIYDVSNPRSRVVAFGGAESSGATTTISLVPSGAGYDVFTDDVIKGHFDSSEFGFFLRAPRHKTFFSQSALNRDEADHMYAYRGNDSLFSTGPLAGTVFATSMYLLAFEDLPMRRSDRDFQDFVATVTFMAPIPLPATAWLLGSVLMVLTVWQRRSVAVWTSN